MSSPKSRCVSASSDASLRVSIDFVCKYHGQKICFALYVNTLLTPSVIAGLPGVLINKPLWAKLIHLWMNKNTAWRLKRGFFVCFFLNETWQLTVKRRLVLTVSISIRVQNGGHIYSNMLKKTCLFKKHPLQKKKREIHSFHLHCLFEDKASTVCQYSLVLAYRHDKSYTACHSVALTNGQNKSGSSVLCSFVSRNVLAALDQMTGHSFKCDRTSHITSVMTEDAT